MNQTDELHLDSELDELDDFEEFNPYLAQLYRKLENIKLTYHILHLSPDEIEDIYEIRAFEDAEKAFEFYIAMDEELAPKLMCLITGTLGLFGYSCAAPITLRSLADLADAEGELPPRIKEKATKALAKRIHYELPFNSTLHGYVI